MATKNNLETVNEVKLVGKLMELKRSAPPRADNQPALLLQGTVAVSPRIKIRFSKYAPKFKKDGTIRKDYEAMEAYAASYNSIATAGEAGADTIQVDGFIVNRDYVNRNGSLEQAKQIRADFITVVDPSTPHCAEVNFQGYIKSITEEGEGLRTTVYGLNYAGDLIPFKFYVPSELKDDFERLYEPGQTTIFNLDYKAIAKTSNDDGPKGIGVQRTRGESRLDYILVGADPAVDDGDPRAISSDTIREAGARRSAALKDLEAAGYQGSGKTQAPQPAAPKTQSADDFDF